MPTWKTISSSSNGFMRRDIKRSMVTGARLFATSSMSFSTVATFAVGKLSRTKHILQNSPLYVKVARRHHPLYDQELEVLNSNKQTLVLRLADGSAMKMPRAWTNADGAAPAPELSLSSVFTVEALRELLALVGTLRDRD